MKFYDIKYGYIFYGLNLYEVGPDHYGQFIKGFPSAVELRKMI